MKAFDIGEVLLLATLWGASFLFMRLSAGEFGPVALAALRVGLASAALLPLLAWRGQGPALRAHWRPIAVVGVLNSALPFVLFGYAALSITAGLASIFNAAAPLFGALVGWCWLGERLSRGRVLGLAIGFAGVLWLAGDKASFKPGGTGFAIAACLTATLCYGIAANYTKKALQGVPPLAVATGSQTSAALALAGPGLWWWPAAPPSPTAWAAVAALALACTALAYLLYFRLIARLGPANAIAVTFLIPAFAVLWGGWVLDERVTPTMLVACGVILLGTALATGAIGPRALPAPRPGKPV